MVTRRVQEFLRVETVKAAKLLDTLLTVYYISYITCDTKSVGISELYFLALKR